MSCNACCLSSPNNFSMYFFFSSSSPPPPFLHCFYLPLFFNHLFIFLFFLNRLINQWCYALNKSKESPSRFFFLLLFFCLLFPPFFPYSPSFFSLDWSPNSWKKPILSLVLNPQVLFFPPPFFPLSLFLSLALCHLLIIYLF